MKATFSSITNRSWSTVETTVFFSVRCDFPILKSRVGSTYFLGAVLLVIADSWSRAIDERMS